MKYRLLALALVLYALGTAYLWYGRPAELPILGASVILPSVENAPPGQLLRQVSAEAPIELIVEPDDGVAPVRAAITGAQHSIDLVVYELDDDEIEQALCTAKAGGVVVRVLLENINSYGRHPNQKAYDALNSCNVEVKWAPSYFALVHQKTLITDNTRAIVMTFNLMSKYYASSRDFGIIDTDPKDVAAIAGAFTADWSGQRTVASNGSDLVWSPGSAPVLLGLINSASSTLDIYTLELEDERVNDALKAAALRGVRVRVVMTYATGWKRALNELTQAGVVAHTYASSAKRFIHAKVIVADSSEAFVGSENFSRQSLDANRELGLLITKPAIVSELQATFAGDWAAARPYSVKN